MKKVLIILAMMAAVPAHAAYPWLDASPTFINRIDLGDLYHTNPNCWIDECGFRH